MKQEWARIRIALLTAFVAVGWWIVPPGNAGELFKCRSQSGEILYSDIACEKSGSSRIGTVEPPARPADRANAPTGAKGATNRVTAKNSPKDPEARRARESELMVVLETPNSTSDQKAAAQEEISSNASSGVCKLSEEDRDKRDAAYADLSGVSRPGRTAARRVLRQLLNSCERI